MAEDARMITMKKIDAERQANEQQASADAAAQANAQADDALRQKQQAEAEAEQAKADTAAAQAVAQEAQQNAQQNVARMSMRRTAAVESASVRKPLLFDSLLNHHSPRGTVCGRGESDHARRMCCLESRDEYIIGWWCTATACRLMAVAAWERRLPSLRSKSSVLTLYSQRMHVNCMPPSIRLYRPWYTFCNRSRRAGTRRPRTGNQKTTNGNQTHLNQ